MAVNLNLLPQEYSVKGGLGAVINIVRRLTLVFLVVFVVLAIGLVGVFIISSAESRALETRIESLRNQIKSREDTETQLVLLKDRLGKVKTALAQASSDESLGKVEPVLGSVTSGSVGELNVDPDKISTSIVFSSSQGLGDFFKSLVSSTAFDSIVMTSFGFNPATGYLVSLRFN